MNATYILKAPRDKGLLQQAVVAVLGVSGGKQEGGLGERGGKQEGGYGVSWGNQEGQAKGGVGGKWGNPKGYRRGATCD